MDDRLRVLISGAADGVGLACATAFASCGAELILCDRDNSALIAIAGSLGAFARSCDAMTEAGVALFAADVAAAFPAIDVLINAAGRGYVRSLAMVRMTRALMPLLRAGRSRRYVFNIAPVGGFTAANGMFPYASSLAAFERLSDALADQVRDNAIEVVSFTPKIALAKLGNRAPADQLYRLQRIDEQHTAACIVQQVAAERPDLRDASPPISRRA